MVVRRFGLVSGVALYGGFEGGETSLEQRNWTAHPTILSGDIDGDGFLNDGNVYHVVTGTEVDSTTVLDGFTITAGLASTNGAGIYLIQSNPTLKNIIIFGNKAVNNGGGMWNDYSNPDLTNVLIFGNSIGGSGAAMWNHYSSPTLTNVTIYGNVSTFRCGGMYNENYSQPILINSILWGNTSPGDLEVPGDLQIFDVISSPANVSYSIVQHGYGDPNVFTSNFNLDVDPLFFDPDIGNLHLQSGSPAIDAGNSDAAELVGITTDLDGSPRFVDIPSIADIGLSSDDDPVVDIGAYEFHFQMLYLPLMVK